MKACDLCGETIFCACREDECRACDGEGQIEHPYLTNYAGSHAEIPLDPVIVDCEECEGTGQIKCDRGGVNCRFSHCYCEAAWDAHNEALHTEEPPLTADERRQLAWKQKKELKR